MYISVIVVLAGVGEYGAMIELVAKKKLLIVGSSTVFDWETRSDIVRAMIVTLRSTATPDENSTIPKNITSMIGTITANSVAAMPLRSSSRSTAERRVLSKSQDIDIVFITRPNCKRKDWRQKARC